MSAITEPLSADIPHNSVEVLEQLPQARRTLPQNSPQLTGSLAQTGVVLLIQKRWTEAEPLLRECLAIREKTQPDIWTTFNTKSMHDAPGGAES